MVGPFIGPAVQQSILRLILKWRAFGAVALIFSPKYLLKQTRPYTRRVWVGRASNSSKIPFRTVCEEPSNRQTYRVPKKTRNWIIGKSTTVSHNECWLNGQTRRAYRRVKEISNFFIALFLVFTSSAHRNLSLELTKSLSHVGI